MKRPSVLLFWIIFILYVFVFVFDKFDYKDIQTIQSNLEQRIMENKQTNKQTNIHPYTHTHMNICYTSSSLFSIEPYISFTIIISPEMYPSLTTTLSPTIERTFSATGNCRVLKIICTSLAVGRQSTCCQHSNGKYWTRCGTLSSGM
eukprot:m.161512 g.161512  ORF g.161512 m.161512 type:complete len:147 (+) comp13402_c0_seq1:1450-1890(+)